MYNTIPNLQNDMQWILVTFLFFIVVFNGYWRCLRLYFLAKEFGLRYDFGDTYKFYFFKRVTFKRSVLTGKINDHEIEFYDLLVNRSGMGSKSDSTLRIDSVFSIDINKYPRLLPTSVLKKILSNLKNN